MLARAIYLGADLFITRRVRGREFRLRPDRQTTETIGYILAVVLAKYDIELQAVCVMSNHWHGVLFDPFARVADFTRDFHSFVARQLNKTFGDEESLWSSAQTSHVRPETADDQIARIAYTMANPVKAGLVHHGRSWPGLRRAWPQTPMRFKRPVGFFRDVAKIGDDEPTWPDVATLEFHRPPGFPELPDNELAVLINERSLDAEERARAEVFARGLTFLGAAAVRKRSRYASPKRKEPRGHISPRVACRDKWRRIERLRANAEWIAEYTECRLRYRAGERDIVFPYGTYKMQVVYGVNVALAPT